MKYPPSPSQQLAITTIDPAIQLQIIACAGSGKTQVISQRIVEILKQGRGKGVGPGNIVAFTFTERAAAELKDRIYQLCRDPESGIGTDEGLAEMYVGTIHGYCLNLLQTPPIYDFLNHTVLDEVRQRLFIDRYCNLSGMTEVSLLNDASRRLERYKHSQLYQSLLGVLGETLVRPELVPEAVRRAYERYMKLCTSHGYLDYTMLLAAAVEALSDGGDDALRDEVSSSLKYLIVDEYQDVNPLQEALIRQLHWLGANVCVVGDDDQTIYQWRGSDVGNILNFERNYPAVVKVDLEDNYRSSDRIVQAAEYIASQSASRLPKMMHSAGAQRYEAGDFLTLNFTTPEAEAAWIVAKICALIGTPYREKDGSMRGLSYSDFAILLRSTKYDAGPIVDELKQAGIDYLVVGMNGLFDTDEVKAMSAVYFYLDGLLPQFGKSMEKEWRYCFGDRQPVDENKQRSILSSANLGLNAQQIETGIAYLNQVRAELAAGNTGLHLQSVYHALLAALDVREENIASARGERAEAGQVAFYNLGKFSKVIDDFESINFKNTSSDLFKSFARFILYDAPNYYPEGWEEDSYIKPDAVQIMTVHRAKGLQWPAVFLPAQRDRSGGGRWGEWLTVWDIIPSECVENAERYKGTPEDERRIFYVALTRAEKYLFCSWSPKGLHRQPSSLFLELRGSGYPLNTEPSVPWATNLTPQPRKATPTLELNFSQLKYFFECPYQFKLRFLYGFCSPIDERTGYGVSLHNALAELHYKAIHGEMLTEDDAPDLVSRHLHLPYTSDHAQWDERRRAAEAAIRLYMRNHADDLTRLAHTEKEIELLLGEGIVVNGRIDLVRKTDTDELAIVDFKSSKRAQSEELTEMQLHIYVVGYEQLKQVRADTIEIHNLDDGNVIGNRVNDALVNTTMQAIRQAGLNVRQNRFNRLPFWQPTCNACAMAGICRDRPTSPQPTLP